MRHLQSRVGNASRRTRRSTTAMVQQGSVPMNVRGGRDRSWSSGLAAAVRRTPTASCRELRMSRHAAAREFIGSVCLGAHLEILPDGRRAALLDAVMERLRPDPELDYVRLNISARTRAPPGSLTKPGRPDPCGQLGWLTGRLSWTLRGT